MKPNPQSGFTLWELLMTMLVAGVLFGIGVPNLMAFQRNGLIISAANNVITGLLAARAEAMKRQVPVTLCATANPAAALPVCSIDASGTNGGFFVWIDENGNFVNTAATPASLGVPDVLNATDGNAVVDANEITAMQPVVIRQAAPGGTINVYSDSGYITFNQNGWRRTTATGAARNSARWILICDDRGNARSAVLATGVLSTARAIQIDGTGRASVLQLQTEVETIRGNIAGAGVTVVCPLVP